MADVRYRRSARCVYALHYHLVWCPKFRRAVWVGRVVDDLRQRLHANARELDVTIDALEIMSDHMQLCVGHVSAETVRRYVEAQTGK